MKKIIFILSIAATVAIVFHSCKKEKNINLKDEPTEASYSQQVMERIIGFGDKMNSSMKSGGDMHIDTAVWNLEALISYENAYPDSSSRDFITVESYYTLHVNGDSIAIERDIQEVYQLMLDSVDYHLSQINASMKFLVFCDVELTEIIGNTAYVQATNGYGFNLVLGWYTPIDDDWIWGTYGGSGLAGNCNGNDFTSDGSNEIQYRINHPAVQTPGPGSYTDYITIYRTGTNLGYDGRIYWDETSTIDKCLLVNTLNDLLSDAHNLIYNYDDLNTTEYIEGFRPQGKDFISIEIIDDQVPGSSGPFLHQYKITYAVPYYASQE